MKLEICFVIDSTGSMEHVLDMVKSKALTLTDDIKESARTSQKTVDQVKLKVIGFKDFYAMDISSYDEVIQESPFFSLPTEKENFEDFVKRLKPGGGEHVRVSTRYNNLEGGGEVNLQEAGRSEDPESGLEALNLAINSAWTPPSQGSRQMIVLWSDATAHPLSAGQIPDSYFTEDKIIETFTRREGSTSTEYHRYDLGDAPIEKPSFYPKGMSTDLKGLTDRWGQALSPSAKRLILFTPDVYPWNILSEEWENVIHWSGSGPQALTTSDYNIILQTIVNSI